ncbi:hypothetical protein [Candidatus Kurthia intestinigallinarum]|uniref:hypothetical protein n=1 Tax=Candidatus Kurthia intestinigallinarum TaxID=1562256 RepID=UPI0013150A07|nr:hypothetical protein [Kurthia sp. 3B1D]
MKKIGHWIIVFLGVVVTLSLSPLSSVNLSGSSELNTQKIVELPPLSRSSNVA